MFQPDNPPTPNEIRIAELEAALRNLVSDVDDYERVNNLAPSHGMLHAWKSMRDAKELLGINAEASKV